MIYLKIAETHRDIKQRTWDLNSAIAVLTQIQLSKVG